MTVALDHQRSDRIPTYQRTSKVGPSQGGFYSSLFHPSVSLTSSLRSDDSLRHFPSRGAPLAAQPCLSMMDPEDRGAHLSISSLQTRVLLDPLRFPPASGNRCHCSRWSLGTGGRDKSKVAGRLVCWMGRGVIVEALTCRL